MFFYPLDSVERFVCKSVQIIKHPIKNRAVRKTRGKSSKPHKPETSKRTQNDNKTFLSILLPVYV